MPAPMNLLTAGKFLFRAASNAIPCLSRQNTRAISGLPWSGACRREPISPPQSATPSSPICERHPLIVDDSRRRQSDTVSLIAASSLLFPNSPSLWLSQFCRSAQKGLPYRAEILPNPWRRCTWITPFGISLFPLFLGRTRYGS